MKEYIRTILYWLQWGRARCALCGGKFGLDDPHGPEWAVAWGKGAVHGRCYPEPSVAQ